jgi:hypothetical protein
LENTVIVDADHAHDRKSHHSICSGIFAFVGRTPAVLISKHQGSIEASTYGLMVLNLMLSIWPSKISCPFAPLSIPLECLLPVHLTSLVTSNMSVASLQYSTP